MIYYYFIIALSDEKIIAITTNVAVLDANNKIKVIIIMHKILLLTL